MFTKTLWIKFDDDLEVKCFCEVNRKNCPLEQKSICKEYIVKFIEIERNRELEETFKVIRDPIKRLEEKLVRQRKKYETELKKSLRAMKKFKI